MLEVAEALADALTAVSPATQITVSPRMLFMGEPPILDVYPADPAEDESAFRGRLWWFTVRMRVSTNDTDGQQDFLYGSRNLDGPESVRAALLADGTDLDDLVDAIEIRGPSGFQIYEDTTSGGIPLLGHEWRIGVHVSEALTS